MNERDRDRRVFLATVGALVVLAVIVHLLWGGA